ncbi:hypothetical protein [Methanoregula formicica]|uniref:Uncharacterized protein n=1 Tax=Methanoregula formicica (strain DSM 22288 / NBRC 105244 / SMSP) TaxID=593750 RepID=L0HBE1_METFS|nr:hypothetical protein [Methanoregula formicica]AGB01121.1 hypothetical protein Metfor_0034 [Methanoregula formicica SMSP]
MTDDTGAMSIDFLVGFTIFMLAFIWVATMIPGLFIGLQSHTIDFDAVAYRTGVILAEDPGDVGSLAAAGIPWELQSNPGQYPDKIARFGLAVSKDTPGILDETKVDRFFNTTEFVYPTDYQKWAIFGDFPYRFNISLKEEGKDTLRSVGDIIPVNYPYGYIRRDVKIRSGSNTTIGETIIKTYHYNNTEEVFNHRFSIMINTSSLLFDDVGMLKSPTGDAAYRFNPMRDRIIINITDFDKMPEPLKPGTTKSVSNVQFYTRSYAMSTLDPLPAVSPSRFLYMDGETTAVPAFPAVFSNGISMVFEPGFFNTIGDIGTDDTIFINLTFTVNQKQQFLNNTHTEPFPYDYNPVNVTQPELADAVMEVAVW